MRLQKYRDRKFVWIGLRIATIGWAVGSLASSTALAVPYASGLSESGGIVTYVLNENADAITVRRTGDSDLVLAGDDLLKGSHTFPKGVAVSYEVEVRRSADSGWTQTSDDALPQNQFFSPRGVAVNKNPGSEYFGRIYVSEGIGGATADRPQITFEGIYSLAADQSDVLGQGDDAAYGDVDWTTSGNSPFRLTVAPDDSLYITDWSDSHSGVWRAPANLDQTTAWPNVLANDNRDSKGLTGNHGSIPAVWVEGTGTDTKLYTMDEDWPDASGINAEGRGDVFRYDIGTATEYSGQAVVQVDDNTPAPAGVILNGLMDFVRDEDGTWWISQFRSDDSKSVPALSHWADGGTEPLLVSGKNPREPGDSDWDSDVDGADFLTWQQNSGIQDGTATVWMGDANGDGNVDALDLTLWEDNFGALISGEIVLDGVYGTLDIHNELDLLVLGSRYSQGVYVVDISDPENPVIQDIIPQSVRANDVAFDVAGNVYVVSRDTETLRVWSPGGDWIATTGSDGSFALTQPAAAASVPEPAAIVLLGLGVFCFLGVARRRH